MFLGEFNVNRAVEPDAASGKLSVVSEHSEEEYQKTIQSIHAQQELLRELNKARVSVVNEEETIPDEHK